MIEKCSNGRDYHADIWMKNGCDANVGDFESWKDGLDNYKLNNENGHCKSEIWFIRIEIDRRLYGSDEMKVLYWLWLFNETRV